MILNVESEKRTATQFAKELVMDKGESATYWGEMIDPDDLARYTTREVAQVNDAVERQLGRVRKFLGL